MTAIDAKLASMRLFDNRHLLKVQIVQIIVIHLVMGLSGARLLLRAKGGGPVTRNNTMSLAIAAKSMAFLTYELSTQHLPKFRRFASLKANMVLNGLEPLFWGAAAFLSIQGNMQRCVGVGCTLSWVIVGAATLLNLVAAYVAVVSYADFRFMRRTGTTRGVSVDRKAPPATEGVVSAGSVENQELAAATRKAEPVHGEQGGRCLGIPTG